MKRIVKLFKEDLVKHTAIVFVGTTLAGVCNLLYRLVCVRLLDPEDFGSLNALMSILMFGSITLSPLGKTLVRYFTEFIAKEEYSKFAATLTGITKRLFIVSIIIFLFFLIFSHQIGSFLNINTWYVFICGIIIILSLFSPVIYSLLQSFQNFKLFSIANFISPFSKLIFGFLFIWLGLGVLGGLFGFLVSSLIIIIFSFIFIPKIFSQENIRLNLDIYSNKVNFSPIYKYFFPVAIVMFSFTLLTNIDIILVKHFFSPLDAGYYSIAQTIGRIFLFFPSAIAIVIFPKSVAAYSTNSHSNEILFKSLGFAAVFSAIGIIVCFLFPAFVLELFTGKANPASNNLVGLFALAMSFYALLWIIIHFLLATHNLRFVLPLLIFSVLEMAAIYFWHNSLELVLYIVLGFAVVSFIVSFFIINLKKISTL